MDTPIPFALITGASRGIGRSTALAFAKQGYDVALLARDMDALDSVAGEVAKLQQSAFVYPCDLSKLDSLEATIEKVFAQRGCPDVAVLNAGLVDRKRLENHSIDDIEYLLRLNLYAPIILTKLLIPRMKALKSGGSLLYVSSISGKVPLAEGSVYAASKYGLTGFAKSLLSEVRDDGIRICTLFPGSVVRDDEPRPTWKLIPEDVASACVFATMQPLHSCVNEIEVRPRINHL